VKRKDKPLRISPEDFELEVKKMLDATGLDLTDYESDHRVYRDGSDGAYEIDILASFSALGVKFKVVVECKRYKSAIKRDLVVLLHNRIQSLGAHKGMLFATSDFQRGAIQYARQHGIALIRMIGVGASYCVREYASPHDPTPVHQFRLPIAGMMMGMADDGKRSFALIDVIHTKHLKEYLEN